MGHETPGLKWRGRQDGRVPYWFAPEKDVQAGYPIKCINLSAFAGDPVELSARCQRLQAELLAWRFNKKISAGPVPDYDGTFGTLLEIYLSDPDSSFQALKPGSRHPYSVYARKLCAHIGEVSVSDTDGRQLKRWFGVWAGQDPVHPKRYSRLPAGRMALSVLKAAVSFGVVCRNEDAMIFKTILGELEFPAPKPRNSAPSAIEVEAIRKAAHASNAPGRALAYAIQFETTLRQWDTIGTWVNMDDPRLSAIVSRGKKWLGPLWGDIDQAMILRVTPTKTENTTARTVAFDLTACPMIVEEIGRVKPEARLGPFIEYQATCPLILNERTWLPYTYDTFRRAWREDALAAGLPDTEASMGGAGVEDRAKVGGHTQRMNSKVYDRDTVEAHRRVMQARKAWRES